MASEAAWFILGGKASGWVAQVGLNTDPTAAWATHWWLKHRTTGERFDPTAEQYICQGLLPPYARGVDGKGAGFMGMRKRENDPWGTGYQPSLRATLLLESLLGGPQHWTRARVRALRKDLGLVPGLAVDMAPRSTHTTPSTRSAARPRR